MVDTLALPAEAEPEHVGRSTLIDNNGGFDLSKRPMSLGAWFRTMAQHREVISILARKDFQVRYKRATLGVLWAVALPLLQGAVLVVVFSRVGAFGHSSFNYPMFVLSGTVAWAYFSMCLPNAATSIVDGSTFTDKVWFPRAILVLAPVLGNLASLAISLAITLALIPLLGSPVTLHLLLLLPGLVLLIAFTTALSLVAAALDVYFRDVKFIVQAGLLLWFYVTPVVYPASTLQGIAPYLDFNPMTGVVDIFQLATAGNSGPIARAIIVSIVVTVVLFVIGVEAQRRHDRLFVDEL